MDFDALPDDMSAQVFFATWTLIGDCIAVDMSKARDVWHGHIRTTRRPLLSVLDTEYQRADERGDTTAKVEVAARKQALRDAPADPAIEVVRAPEALQAVRPLP